MFIFLNGSGWAKPNNLTRHIVLPLCTAYDRTTATYTGSTRTPAAATMGRVMLIATDVHLYMQRLKPSSARLAVLQERFSEPTVENVWTGKMLILHKGQCTDTQTEQGAHCIKRNKLQFTQRFHNIQTIIHKNELLVSQPFCNILITTRLCVFPSTQRFSSSNSGNRPVYR